LEPITISYKFELSSGQKKTFTVNIDPETMLLIPRGNEVERDWTKLEFKQCEHCPLNPAESPHCPAASNLATVVEEFVEFTSHEDAIVVVKTNERHYYKKIPLQKGLFGIFGIMMATSACPHLDFLKPMARFHLPFSTTDETMVRSTSMYLLKQYFVGKSGGEPDFDLAKLEENYDKVNTVNAGIAARIKAVTEGDADANAVIILDSFATVLSMELSDDMSGIKEIFVKDE
jgi:hypothetical protein